MVPTKNLTAPAVVAAGALLMGAAPPEAPYSLACTPSVVLEKAEPDAVQQALTEHLSRRFFITTAVTERIVAAAHESAREVGLDPLLLLAVISIESSFNPTAESVMGAKGLMQIIPKYHVKKLEAAGGEDVVFDPESNIHVGTRILQEYVYRTGTLEAGLQFYNGAWRDASANYARKVLAERHRLQQVVAAVGRT